MVSIYDESVLLIVFMKMVIFKNPPSYISHKLPLLCFGKRVVCIFLCELDFVQLCAIVSINGFNYFKNVEKLTIS
jgi:hypothetical protein